MSKDKKKKTIAILRGGKHDYHRSMKSGANVMLSLSKYPEETNVIDVVIDEKGNWFEKGIPSDVHRVFSKADYYVDFTHDVKGDHHNLGSKLDVKQVFKNDFVNILSRVNIKRILNQIGLNTSRYVVFRDDKNLENSLKEIWGKFQTPIIVKDGKHIANKKSLLTYSFLDTYKRIKEILKSGSEAILEEHVDGKYISLSVIPNYRGEDLYIPTPIETINAENKIRSVQGKEIKDKYLPEHSHNKISLFHLDDDTKKRLKYLAKEIHKGLALDYHVLIDICLVKNKKGTEIKILELHTNPHLSEESRFSFILENSGVDMGRFVLDNIEKLEEENLSY
ncbi:MAG: hypothetical protein WCO35_02985 [Candidatus Nomurabacteria bacterium]